MFFFLSLLRITKVKPFNILYEISEALLTIYIWVEGEVSGWPEFLIQSDFGYCFSLCQGCHHRDLKAGLSSVCCKPRPFCCMQSLAGLDTPWIHSATTALGRQKAEEGGREDKLQDLKLLCSHVATGVWTGLGSRASNRSHGVRQGSRAGVRNILQKKEKEEGLKGSRSCFHPYLRQNFLKHMHVAFPFRKLPILWVIFCKQCGN